MTIAKELRMAGRMIRLVLRPNPLSFRLLNRAMQLIKERKLAGYDNRPRPLCQRSNRRRFFPQSGCPGVA
ncbi:hypothetical protein KFU94_58605 [Chloroflexi bacterium TSY]|nr:hypothetical protein [Chloroflexi bacterium TSY]